MSFNLCMMISIVAKTKREETAVIAESVDSSGHI